MLWHDWVTVIVAAMAGFMVGGIWYGPLFGKSWMAEVGLTPDDAKKANMVKIYGTTFVLSLISAIALGHLFAHFEMTTRTTMMMSTGIALGFIVPAIGTNYLFSRKSLKLFLIDAGYWIAFYAAMGLVFVLLG